VEQQQQQQQRMKWAELTMKMTKMMGFHVCWAERMRTRKIRGV
jgi:hypothetical protein